MRGCVITFLNLSQLVKKVKTVKIYVLFKGVL